MKTALALLAILSSSLVAHAIDYVTLFDGEEHTLDPTSLIEASYRTSITTGFSGFTVHRGKASQNIRFARSDGLHAGSFPLIGVTKISAVGGAIVTLKITPKAEINVVAPGTVLVLPENSTGNFDVVIEASDDLVGWMPFFSQTVNAATAKKFFRTRVVKTPTP